VIFYLMMTELIRSNSAACRCNKNRTNTKIHHVRLLVSTSPNQPTNSVFLSHKTSTSQPRNQPANMPIISISTTMHGLLEEERSRGAK